MKALFFIVVGLVLVMSGCQATAEATTVRPKEVVLVATDIAFDQTQLQVKSGQLVRLTLRNDGVLEHDFSVLEIALDGEAMVREEQAADDGAEHDMSQMGAEPDVHVAASQGERNTVEFTPSEPGEYAYFCTVAGHREAGMAGTLVVVP